MNPYGSPAIDPERITDQERKFWTEVIETGKHVDMNPEKNLQQYHAVLSDYVATRQGVECVQMLEADSREACRMSSSDTRWDAGQTSVHCKMLEEALGDWRVRAGGRSNKSAV
jgi:hypothetical protein